ncbi:hypothetical protein FRC07_009432 [Ceratobasidium sp. 392]|nr:hypothetical protein FRC07_009432 [Ceratobasidium sp. 392]
MIYKNLSAWITDSQGNQLKELQQKDVDDQTAECWIPSEEGANFQIMWQAVRNFEPRLGLRCSVRLDGRGITSRWIPPEKIARGIPGKKEGMTVGPGSKRLFVFSRQSITDSIQIVPNVPLDRDELASPNGSVNTNLGVIRVTLDWVRTTKITRVHRYMKPEEPGLLHERAAKKGHCTTAALGDVVPSPRPKSNKSFQKVDAGLPPVVFVFRYGPRDWLMAKDIIPNEPAQPSPSRKRDASESKPVRPSKKLKREPSPAPTTIASRSQSGTFDPSDVIDIDDLESDPDSDVVVPNDSERSGFSIKLEETKRMKSEATLT